MTSVILMVGISGSGKSTKVADIIKQYESPVVISTDDLREFFGSSASDQSVSRVAFNTAYSILEQNLIEEAALIIVDAMNLTPKSRKKFLQIAEKYGAETTAVCMLTPLEECLRRNTERDRKVPPDVVASQAKRFRPPTGQDGEFDHVTYVYYIKPAEVKYL